MVELRVLTPDDWSLWRQLRLAALTDAPHAFAARLADWTGEGDAEERWRGRLAIAGSHNVVAVLDGHGVGMASGVPTSRPGAVEVISMWVAPDARGRGVGDALVRDVERWARSADARVLRLSVAEGNAEAEDLYRRHGFRFTGELGDVMPDGTHRERVMERVVPPPGAAEPLRVRMMTDDVSGIGLWEESITYDEEDLPLPDELRVRLRQWVDEYTATIGGENAHWAHDDYYEHDRRGHALSLELQRALGSEFLIEYVCETERLRRELAARHEEP